MKPPPRTVAALMRRRYQESLHLADRLDPSVDEPCTVMALTREERLFLAELLRRAVNETGPRVRRLHSDAISEDTWLTVDHLVSGDPYRTVAERWGRKIGHAGKIISEQRKRAEKLIADTSPETLAGVLRLQLLLNRNHK